MDILKQILDTATGFVKKFEQWVDESFGLFTNYSKGYSNFIIYGVLLFIISKFFKLHIKVNR